MAVTVPAATDQIDYADLYARWERGNWSATDIDFTQDRIDWHERFTDEQRRGALWLYTLFFHGEDSVADNLSPYIDAAPLEEQKYFLATQQVDEARHAVFFHRWMHEVVGVGDGSLGDGLRATQHELTWGHRKLFGRLDRMADELRCDRSPLTLARAVTLYHVVVEGTLAQPGQHMIETSLERMDLMPGFREGMRNVAIDEQRHIAFGVKLLADLYRDDPQGIAGRDRRPHPRGPAVHAQRADPARLGPLLHREPRLLDGGPLRGGRARQRGAAAGDRAAARRDRPLPVSDGHHAARARPAGARAAARRPARGRRRRPGRPRSRDRADLLRPAGAQRARRRRSPPGTTIQWDFPDHEPWYLLIEGPARKRAIQGRVARPTVRLRMRWDDFGELVSERAQPHHLMLRGRMRPWGDPRVLLRLQRLFH